eukprot:5260406-Pyramimonas_sp.AAC.2
MRAEGFECRCGVAIPSGFRREPDAQLARDGLPHRDSWPLTLTPQTLRNAHVEHADRLRSRSGRASISSPADTRRRFRTPPARVDWRSRPLEAAAPLASAAAPLRGGPARVGPGVDPSAQGADARLYCERFGLRRVTKGGQSRSWLSSPWCNT